MASIETEQHANGKTRYRVCYKGLDGRRKRLRLTTGTKKRDAESIGRRVDELVSAKVNNNTLAPSLLDWLAGVAPEVRLKLRDAGLLPEHVAASLERFTIGGWFKRYVDERTDIKPGTREQIEIAGADLVRHFGKKKTIDQVTPADANRWRSWMLTSGNRRFKDSTKLAEDTVRRRTGRAKQVFGEAVSRGLIMVNPFAKLASASRVNTTRQRFIEGETIHRVIDAAPSAEWRLIIALARFGGLRIPSELSTLRWDRVNLAEGRITIEAPKTEHHRDGGLRVVPIFPELRPFLEDAWELRGASGYVIETAKRRTKRAPLGTPFIRIIESAGLIAWPKVFQNLRATRETELLAAGYPAKDVASWLGNSVPVAMKHYAMATAEQFEKATQNGSAGNAGPWQPSAKMATPTTPKPTPEHDAGVGQTGGANRGAKEAKRADDVEPGNEKSPQFAGSFTLVSVGDCAESYPART